MSTKKKKQISVTLDEDQLTWMDNEIKDNRFATRSHAIVYALTQLIKQSVRPGDVIDDTQSQGIKSER